MAGRENQEIRGGVFEYLLKKARHTTNIGETSFVTFCGIYNDKQSQGVFDGEGIGCQGTGGSGRRKERTVNQRKREVDYLTSFPWLKVTGLAPVEREFRKCHRFRKLGLSQKFSSKYREGYRTRMQRVIDRTAHPESHLHKRRKRQTGGNPAISPRHGVHPGCVVGGWCKIT